MSGCCVHGCTNRYSTKGLKFYRIPTGSRPFQKNRRRLWLQAIKRVDWSEDIIKNARVCSAHFISGEASLDSSSPDFVPSVFVYTKPSQNPEAKLERKRRRDDRPITAAKLCVSSKTLKQECSMDHCPGVKTSPQTATLGCVIGISPMAKLLGHHDSHGMRGRHSNSLTTSAIPLNGRNKWSQSVSGVAAEDDFDEDFEDDEEEDEEDHSLAEDGSNSLKSEPKGEWLTRRNNIKFKQIKGASTKRVYTRSDVALGQLTKRFMQLLLTAPNGILDLNEASHKLGSRKRRVYDITNVLNGIHLIRKTSKNKIQWVSSSPVSCFGSQWTTKTKADLLHLKSTEEALDCLIKDCAHQLFSLTDLKDNADSAYVTYEDICQIGVFMDQTVIAIRAPDETKLEVPTPTEDSIQIHLKGCRGPIHIHTCETEGPSDSVDSAKAESKPTRPVCFLTLEESRIRTQPLVSDVSSTVAAVQSA